MKIIFIVPEIAISGGMRQIFEIANRLVNKGHSVSLYTPIIPFNPYKGIFKAYFFRYRIKYALKYILGQSMLPEKLFDRFFEIKYVPVINNLFVANADAVIATSWTTARYVYRLSSKKGKKFYFIQGYEEWNSNVKYVDESYILPLNRIVVSKYLHDFLKNKFNVESEMILIGINTARFYNDDKKFNSPKRILFMDHQLEIKNVQGAVKTIIKLKENYPDLIVRCIGLSKFHEIPAFVEFHENPGDEEIRKLYSDSDIFIFSSFYEGFGLPPAEAMACKCAVVGNRVAALPEYAIDKETAILTDPSEPEQLFEGVKNLLENEKELERISFAGYNHIKKVLDWDIAINKIENYLVLKND